MKPLGEVLQLAIQFLKEKGETRARQCAELLLASVMSLPRLDLYMQFDRPLQEDELMAYRALLKRKMQGEPLEYLLGEVEFYGCRLTVNPSVLIPRPETEILLDLICKQLKGKDLTGLQAWDLCCGSGCLGIGLKKTFPALEVSLSDLSKEALAVARTNAERSEVALECLQGDLLTPFQGRKADLILCNPPYISQKEFTELDPCVRNHEPSMALVGGESGLLFYERLNQELPSHLNPGARVWLEIGSQQREGVFEAFSAKHWKEKRCEKDWAGHDRFFFLEFE